MLPWAGFEPGPTVLRINAPTTRPMCLESKKIQNNTVVLLHKALFWMIVVNNVSDSEISGWNPPYGMVWMDLF